MNKTEACIKRVLAGDQAAFSELYNETIDGVYRTLYFLSGSDRHAVDDIVQNVYMELYRGLHRFDCSRSLQAWLSGIALRQMQAYRRANWRELRRRQRLRSSLEAERGDAGSHAALEADDLADELSKLSEKQREAVVLRYINDLTQGEIAELLQIPIGTVKSRLHDGLNKLREDKRRQKNE